MSRPNICLQFSLSIYRIMKISNFELQCLDLQNQRNSHYCKCKDVNVSKNAMKMYADMQGKCKAFLISALDGGGRRHLHTCTTLFMTFAGQESGWVSESLWKWQQRRKYSCLCWVSNPGHQSVQSHQIILSLTLPHECYLFQLKLNLMYEQSYLQSVIHSLSHLHPNVLHFNNIKKIVMSQSYK